MLERARRELRQGIRAWMLLGKGPKIDAKAVTERIVFTTDYERLAAVDFVVENVTEKWALKQEVYRRLEAVCRPGVVFAANTSAISITKIGAATRRPAQVVGMHFMNPAPMKPMVELIRVFHTSPETLAVGQRLGRDGQGGGRRQRLVGVRVEPRADADDQRGRVPAASRSSGYSASAAR